MTHTEEKTIVAEDFMERFRDLASDSSIRFCGDTFDTVLEEFKEKGCDYHCLNSEKNSCGYERFEFCDGSAIVFYNGFLEVEGEEQFTFKYPEPVRTKKEKIS